MSTNCVTAPEITPSTGAGGLVRTHETVAMFEVGVAVPLDLPEVRVPVATVSDPAENGLLPAEVGDSPGIAVFIIAAASIIINTTPAVTVLEDSTASARFRNWHPPDIPNSHLGGVLTRRPPKSAEGGRGAHVFLMPFRNIGRWRVGTWGGRLLILASSELSGEVGLDYRKTNRLLLSQRTRQGGAIPEPWVMEGLYLPSAFKKGDEISDAQAETQTHPKVGPGVLGRGGKHLWIRCVHREG